MATLKPVATALEAWLRCLLVNALQRFEAEKQAQGLATFGDLVRKALDSLKTHGLETPAPKLLLVDEYQDTSKVQDAFLEALDAERMVRVGDVKQAIYGFRGGDPDLLRDRLAAAGEGAFRLASNFRSTPEVVSPGQHLCGPGLAPVGSHGRRPRRCPGARRPIGASGGIGSHACAIDFGRPSGTGGLDLGPLPGGRLDRVPRRSPEDRQPHPGAPAQAAHPPAGTPPAPQGQGHPALRGGQGGFLGQPRRAAHPGGPGGCGPPRAPHSLCGLAAPSGGSDRCRTRGAGPRQRRPSRTARPGSTGS